MHLIPALIPVQINHHNTPNSFFFFFVPIKHGCIHVLSSVRQLIVQNTYRLIENDYFPNAMMRLLNRLFQSEIGAVF